MTATTKVWHGQLRTHNTWKSMLQRCYDPSQCCYERYGGRGITVCDGWKESFDNFISDMGERPQGETLDRIDNSGNYEPGNCRWATPSQQSLNRRPRKAKVLFTIYGKSRSRQSWHLISGTPVRTMRDRQKKGWPHKACVFGLAV